MTPNETNIRNIDFTLYKANIVKAISYIQLRSTNNFIASMHFILRTQNTCILGPMLEKLYITNIIKEYIIS